MDHAYERGFLTKCAEYGFDGRELLKYVMSKRAQYLNTPLVAGAGALGGGLLGLAAEAMRKKKKDEKSHYLRNFLTYGGIGGLAGLGVGAGSNYITDKNDTIRALADAYSALKKKYEYVGVPPEKTQQAAEAAGFAASENDGVNDFTGGQDPKLRPLAAPDTYSDHYMTSPEPPMSAEGQLKGMDGAGRSSDWGEDNPLRR